LRHIAAFCTFGQSGVAGGQAPPLPPHSTRREPEAAGRCAGLRARDAGRGFISETHVFVSCIRVGQGRQAAGRRFHSFCIAVRRVHGATMEGVGGGVRVVDGPGGLDWGVFLTGMGGQAAEGGGRLPHEAGRRAVLPAHARDRADRGANTEALTPPWLPSGFPSMPSPTESPRSSGTQGARIQAGPVFSGEGHANGGGFCQRGRRNPPARS